MTHASPESIRDLHAEIERLVAERDELAGRLSFASRSIHLARLWNDKLFFELARLTDAIDIGSLPEDKQAEPAQAETQECAECLGRGWMMDGFSSIPTKRCSNCKGTGTKDGVK
jgi:hypothetical protein